MQFITSEAIFFLQPPEGRGQYYLKSPFSLTFRPPSEQEYKHSHCHASPTH